MEHLREEQVLPYLEGRIAAEERARIERHLEACTECRLRGAELRAVLQVLDEWPAVEPFRASPQGEPSEGFAAAVRRRIEAEAQATAEPSWWPLRVRPLYIGALAAAAVILLGVALWFPTAPERGGPPTAAPSQTVQTTEAPAAEVGGEPESGELAMIEPVVLEDYELLRDFDVLFETRRAEAGKQRPETRN